MSATASRECDRHPAGAASSLVRSRWSSTHIFLTGVRRAASKMAGPDGSQYQGYQNESETTKLLSPSPPSSPTRRGDHPLKPTATPQEDVRKHYKYALGTGYMFAMGVCGIVLVALGSTLDDLATNSGTTATDVSVCWIHVPDLPPYDPSDCLLYCHQRFTSFCACTP